MGYFDLEQNGGVPSLRVLRIFNMQASIEED